MPELPPPVTARLAVAGCETNPHADPIGSVCGFVRDHTGGAEGLAVAVISRAIWPLVILGLVIVASRVVRGVADRAVARSGADAQIRTLVHNVLVAGGVLVAVSAALYCAGLDLGIFLTIGGLGTLAIGLAFQDLLRNILAGILLLIERPFVIGDVITLEAITGTVQTIELRTTAVRQGDGKLAIIPNLEATSKIVVNLSAYTARQFTVSVLVPVGNDLETAIREARSVLESTPEAVADPAPRVQPAIDIGEIGVTLQLQYWLEFRDHDPDAVAASVVRRLQAALAGQPVPPDLVPDEHPAASDVDPDQAVAGPSPARRLRRLLPGIDRPGHDRGDA